MAALETNSCDHLGDASYPAHMSNGLNQLRQQGAFCDVIIVVGEQRFPAHKAVLSVASNYFQCMFSSSSGFQESTSNEVTVPGTRESFTQLLNFAYTGFFDLSPTNIAGILKMACYMHFDQAVGVCAEYLSGAKDKLSIDDCFEIWFIAGNHGSLTDLAEAFRRHLVHNFPNCAKSESFLEHATLDFIVACLEDEEVESDTSTEQQIFQVVINWLKCDWTKRKEHNCTLLKKIRLGLISEEMLQDVMKTEMAADEESRGVLEEVLRLKASGESYTVDPLSHRYPAFFATRNTISALLVIGGPYMPFNAFNKSTMFFNDKCRGDGSWVCLSHFANLPFPPQVQLYDYVTVVAHGQLYFAGGESRETSVNNQADLVCFEEHTCCLNNVFRYNTSINKWDCLRPMLVARKAFSMVTLGQYVFAIGGSNGQGTILLDVEYYDISTKTWLKAAPLLEAVRCTSAVVHDERILVCGTQESMQFTPMDNRYRYFGDMIIQLYNPSANTWHRVYKICYPLNWQAYSTVLAVQDDVCYRVCYECSMWHTNRPRINRLVCDFHSEIPSVGIGEGQDQQGVPLENKLKGFCIDKQVFININGFITSLDIDCIEGTDVDLSRWLSVNENTSSRGMVSYTFDKRILSDKDQMEHGV